MSEEKNIDTIQEENQITQYVDEFGNPIDPSLIDENGNYIGETVTQYVDEFGNPIDPSLIDENGNYIGNDIQKERITPESVSEDLSVTTNTNTISAAAHQMDNKQILEGMVTFDYNNVPITDIVNSIILDAINKGASDIHFDPFEEGIKIRLRIDGQLNDYSIVPMFVKKNMVTRIKIISGMNITETRIPQDGAIRTEIQDKTIDLRVSCLPTNLGEKVVIRVMDYSMSANGIETLDFSEQNLERVKKILSLPNGIILVTGATGTGKSTTVYSMLQKLNVEGTNLITVEDPIEMNIAGINQVQTQSEIGLNFATVLRSILRQDPDVIMIGEIRDDETARIAVRASITGHLVLSTIHTNNSLSTIERLIDMSVERYLLGSSLAGIVSQKLARRLCEHCKKERPTTEYEKNIFKKALNKDVDKIYEAVGCPHCSKGYRGRIAIHEVLVITQRIRDGITNNVEKSVLRDAVYEDCDTMLQDGLMKVINGITSFDEIIKLIDLEDDLGSGTQLGLENQLYESNVVSQKEKTKEEVVELSDDDKLRNYLEKLFNLKDDIKKKKFNRNIKDIISDIDELDNYDFTDDDINSAKELIDKIKEYQTTLSDEFEKNEYEESIKLLSSLFDIDEPIIEDDNEFDKIFDDINVIKSDLKDDEIVVLDENGEDTQTLEEDVEVLNDDSNEKLSDQLLKMDNDIEEILKDDDDVEVINDLEEEQLDTLEVLDDDEKFDVLLDEE